MYQADLKPVGATGVAIHLAREDGLIVDRDVECQGLFASKLAPTFFLPECIRLYTHVYRMRPAFPSVRHCSLHVSVSPPHAYNGRLFAQ